MHGLRYDRDTLFGGHEADRDLQLAHLMGYARLYRVIAE